MDVFKKVILAGLGAMSLSRERAQEVVAELVKAGELREKDGKAFVDDMIKKAGGVKKDVEVTVSKQIDAAAKKLNLASRDSLKKLERRIQELERELAAKTRTTKKSAKRPAGK